ncbi:hypothetical protein BDZ97DRAFT_1768397 [Flammula alnicola]|nr:hypothetical protein BDZ97DRAFT_1768397 [Flammula alnicola]
MTSYDINGDRPPVIYLGKIRAQHIWTAKEKMILKAHLEGYRGAPRKTNRSEIKETWKGRYDKKNMKKDRAIKKEWEKKKYVSVANIHLVWEPCGHRARFEDPRIQLNVTFDTVVQAKKKMEIQEEAGGCPTAKKSIKDTLSEAEREEYEREVEEWKTAGIPKEVQAREDVVFCVRYQSLVADGTLSTPADSNSTGYRGVRQVPTFSQYDPTAYQA